jgi:hypothetical protein
MDIWKDCVDNSRESEFNIHSIRNARRIRSTDYISPQPLHVNKERGFSEFLTLLISEKEHRITRMSPARIPGLGTRHYRSVPGWRRWKKISEKSCNLKIGGSKHADDQGEVEIVSEVYHGSNPRDFSEVWLFRLTSLPF